jgi:hypothetical protein
MCGFCSSLDEKFLNMKTLSSFLVDDILRRGKDDIWIGEGWGGLGRRPVVRQSGRTQRHKLKRTAF